ncbi:hypothetical protein FQN57_006972 [Myotisia sp. PD_48]|nr:hypothetical protein FQN57_006972 [Myotisia sp. PD_48]
MVSTAVSFLPVNTATMTETMDHRKDLASPSTPRADPLMKLSNGAFSQTNGSFLSGRNGSHKPVNGSTSESKQQPLAHPIQLSSGTMRGQGSRSGSMEESSPHSSPHEPQQHNPESDPEHYPTDNEMEMGATGPPSKKKKGQRFFCTAYPPCSLSFTRSEHLARHIRLDNLRQHAQTVHVNEDIPGDSLAATGTRFQRQIRTDRVRPAARARAGTVGSQVGHSRGHSRNLSTSSITSNVSSYSQAPQDIRRRPPPLIMASNPPGRANLALETRGSPPRTPPGQTRGFPSQSPNVNMFTPASATPYGPPIDTASPYYASPSSATSGYWHDRSGRRLSVPSGTRPFETQQFPLLYPRHQAPPNAPYPPNESLYSQPAASQAPAEPAGPPSSEAEWRRRTWHPSSYTNFARPATSGLWHQQSVEPVQPTLTATSQGPPNQTTRLPGIESFDHVQQRSQVPPRREPSPMAIDHPVDTRRSIAVPLNYAPSSFIAPAHAPRPPPPFSGAEHRRGNLSLDTTLQRTLTRLDLHGNNPQRDAAQWGQQTIGELQNVGSRPSTSSTYHAPGEQESPSDGPGPAVPTEQHSVTAPTHTMSSPRQQMNRYAWSASHSSTPGPLDSVPGRPPSHVPTSSAFVSNVEPRSGFYSGAAQEHGSGISRLEALVAVATSEENDQRPSLPT